MTRPREDHIGKQKDQEQESYLKLDFNLLENVH